MGRLALCIAGLVVLVLAIAEAQVAYPSPPYSAAPTPPIYSSPPQSSSAAKQTPPPKKPSVPAPKKQTPPPPAPKKQKSPPPPKKQKPPPPPKKQKPPPPPKKPSPPKKQTPPSPPIYVSPPAVWSPSPPVVATPPPSLPVWSPSPPVWSPSPPVWSPSPPVWSPSPPVWSPSPPVWSPPVSTPPSPASAVAAKRIKCRNKQYPSCYFREFSCPANCPHSCEVDCQTCSPVCNCNKPGAVCQDPRFIGADGLTFYFHGKKEQDFCLVTDSNLHINAHFIGKRNTNMGRDFTWVQSLGILFNDHQVYLGAQKTATWNNAVDRLALSFDGQPIILPEAEGANWKYAPAGVSITRSRDTNGIVIEVDGKLKIKAVVVPITKKDSLVHNYGITDEDCFAHLDLSFKFYSLSGEVNGVLGQTYASNYVSKVKVGVAMPVVGGEKKFSTSSLFGTDCAVSRFVGQSQDDATNFEFGDLNCASGINGRGVVCKR